MVAKIVRVSSRLLDMPTLYGSQRYADHVTTEDARIVKLLRAKGCLIFGKMHITEFAMGAAGQLHPPTRNPHDVRRAPGASSAGSAAAVADFECPLAIGTQTGGSIITPASYCGIYGWKPTFNLFSLYGTYSISPSCDTLGFFGRSAGDLSLLADCLLVGQRAPASVKSKLRIAWTATPVRDVPADADAVRAIESAAIALREAGIDVSAVSLPDIFDNAHVTASNLVAKEFSASLEAELAEGTDGIDQGELDVVEQGRKISLDQYREAQAAISTARTSFQELMQDFDAFMTLSKGEEAPISQGVAGDPAYNGIWTVGDRLPAIISERLKHFCRLSVSRSSTSPVGVEMRTCLSG